MKSRPGNDVTIKGQKVLIILVVITAAWLAWYNGQGIGFCDASEVSPFGSNNAFNSTKRETSDCLVDLGVSWIADHMRRTRIEQKRQGRIVYDFSPIDGKLREYGKQTLSNAWFVINVESRVRFEDGRKIRRTNTYLPDGPASFLAYEEYLRQLIEYVNTKVPGWQVKYWSIDNEQSEIYLEAFGDDTEGAEQAVDAYARLVETSYNIIKSEYPEAQVVFGGPASNTKDKEHRLFYKEALKKLKGKGPGGYFDFFDYHNFASFQKYKENAKGQGIDFFRALLEETGFEDKPIIIKAGATHSGVDALGIDRLQVYQTEKQQAEHLLKRFVYHVAEGIKLILWGTIKENKSFGGDDHSVFNFTGLMYNGVPEVKQCDPEVQLPCPDPGDGIKKLSYYTFKLFMEKVDGCDWDSVQTIAGGQDNIYVYKLTKKDTEDAIWVVWWDYFDEQEYLPGDTKTITITVGGTSESAVITDAIPDAESGTELHEQDYPNFFTTDTKSAVDEQVTLELKEIPVFVEL